MASAAAPVAFSSFKDGDGVGLPISCRGTQLGYESDTTWDAPLIFWYGSSQTADLQRYLHHQLGIYIWKIVEASHHGENP